MITEPEMTDESGDDRIADVLSDDQGPRPPGRSWRPGEVWRPGETWRRQPWVWALGGAVVASAVWTGVLRGVDYGHTSAPDLHGYHLGENPCTGQNLEPLVDALGATSMNAMPGPVSTGTTLDHVSCDLNGDATTGDGWVTSYTVSVTVDLHKKTDPRTEFEDSVRTQVSAPNATLFGGTVIVAHSTRTTKPLTGLGDRAILTTGANIQSISVLHGGGVFSVSVSANNQWNGTNPPPTHADGSPTRPLLVDTKRLAAYLPRTVRHLMSALAAR